jgi:6-phosphogluconolactonase (cycloisomerase 2 family)
MLALGRTVRRLAVGVAAGALVLALSAGSAAAASFGFGGSGAVYTSTNSPAGNAVLAFDRSHDGSLTPAGSFPTGGIGTGGGLGNQGAVVLDDRHDLLFVVNAGSDQITSFHAGRHGLRRLDVESSGGDRPISLSVHGGLLYVLNAGSDQIAGFRVGHGGGLRPLPGSIRSLSGTGTDPAQVEFSPHGGLLVVTEKATNRIDTFRIGFDGRPGQLISQPSAGQTPFGFAFDKRAHLIVSEAFGGAPNASVVSSYGVAPDGAISAISPLVATEQTAACWVAVTDNGKFAYTTNTGSGSISTYEVNRDGSISLLASVGADTGAGSAPTDLALSEHSRRLFVLNSGAGSVGAYRVRGDGGLVPAGGVGSLPAGATGLAAD